MARVASWKQAVAGTHASCRVHRMPAPPAMHKTLQCAARELVPLSFNTCCCRCRRCGPQAWVLLRLQPTRHGRGMPPSHVLHPHPQQPTASSSHATRPTDTPATHTTQPTQPPCCTEPTLQHAQQATQSTAAHGAAQRKLHGLTIQKSRSRPCSLKKRTRSRSCSASDSFCTSLKYHSALATRA